MRKKLLLIISIYQLSISGGVTVNTRWQRDLFYKWAMCAVSSRVNMERLEPCSHEEADTHLLIHALDAQRCGHQRIKIRSNGTDVVVLAVSTFHTIQVERL